MSAFTIYLLVVGSSLADWSALWLVWAGALGVAIKRRITRDEAADETQVWYWAVWMLFPTAQWSRTFAHERHWPAGQQQVISTIGDWVVTPILVCASTVVLFQLVRWDVLPWLRRRRNRSRQTS